MGASVVSVTKNVYLLDFFTVNKYIWTNLKQIS